MCVDFLPEIRHTAVADFNCRPIKDLLGILQDSPTTETHLKITKRNLAQS